MTTSLSNSILVPSPGTLPKTVDQRLSVVVPINISFRMNGIGKQLLTSKRVLTIQAAYRGDEGCGSSSYLFGGFILGGLIAGTLSFACDPQISKALAGADSENLMSKLPNFI